MLTEFFLRKLATLNKESPRPSMIRGESNRCFKPFKDLTISRPRTTAGTPQSRNKRKLDEIYPEIAPYLTFVKKKQKKPLTLRRVVETPKPKISRNRIIKKLDEDFILKTTNPIKPKVHYYIMSPLKTANAKLESFTFVYSI